MIDAPTDEFAVFYLLLNIAALFVAVSALFVLQQTRGVQAPLTTHLRVSQIAYLAGGRSRVIHSALASLAQRDAVRVVGGYIEPKESKSAANETLSEREILSVFTGSPLTPSQLYRRCKIDEDGLQSQLREAGLVPTDVHQLRMRLIAAAIASLPSVAGVIRLLHRLPQHRPVILLGMFCLVAVMSGALLTMIPIGEFKSEARRPRGMKASSQALPRAVRYPRHLRRLLFSFRPAAAPTTSSGHIDVANLCCRTSRVRGILCQQFSF
jgi:uncharacterized protein (TIGR04222 family)